MKFSKHFSFEGIWTPATACLTASRACGSLNHYSFTSNCEFELKLVPNTTVLHIRSLHRRGSSGNLASLPGSPKAEASHSSSTVEVTETDSPKVPASSIVLTDLHHLSIVYAISRRC